MRENIYSLLASELLIGLVATIIYYHLFKPFIVDKIYYRCKSSDIIGEYLNGTGKVFVTHIKKNYFIAKGSDSPTATWESRLEKKEDNTLEGKYFYFNADGNFTSWGEHHLIINKEGIINVEWRDTSSGHAESGKLTWKKVRKGN